MTKQTSPSEDCCMLSKTNKRVSVSYTLCGLVGWGGFSFEKCVRNGFIWRRVVFQDGEERTVPSVSGVWSFKSEHQCIKSTEDKPDDRHVTKATLVHVIFCIYTFSKMLLCCMWTCCSLTCPGRTAQQRLCLHSTSSSLHQMSNNTPSSREGEEDFACVMNLWVTAVYILNSWVISLEYLPDSVVSVHVWWDRTAHSDNL